MKFLSTLVFGLAGVLLSACSAFAVPTPKDSALTWDAYTDPSATGYYLYWDNEADSPRDYNDTQRVQIPRGATPEQIQVITTLPGAKGSLCFKLTAHDSLNRESAFSNEACGWFGIPEPKGLQKK